jgi:hypothetical protein
VFEGGPHASGFRNHNVGLLDRYVCVYSHCYIIVIVLRNVYHYYLNKILLTLTLTLIYIYIYICLFHTQGIT